jgi:hypothetical protein
MPANRTIAVPDDNALNVQVCRTGYRIKRGSEHYIWVSPGEVTNLINLLADAQETREIKTK